MPAHMQAHLVQSGAALLSRAAPHQFARKSLVSGQASKPARHSIRQGVQTRQPAFQYMPGPRLPINPCGTVRATTRVAQKVGQQFVAVAPPEKLVAAELAAALAGPRAEPTNPKCPVTLEAAVSNKSPHSPTQPSHSPASWQLVSGQQVDSKAWSCRCGFYGRPATPFCGKLGTTSNNRDHLSSPMPIPARRPTSAASHHSRTQAHKNDNENRLGEPCRKEP